MLLRILLASLVITVISLGSYYLAREDEDYMLGDQGYVWSSEEEYLLWLDREAEYHHMNRQEYVHAINDYCTRLSGYYE